MATDTVRSVGPWTAGALVVGHTIGVGIFLTPAAVIGALGAPSLVLLVWIALSALVVAGALTFGRLAARRPEAGGLYVFLREGWGQRLAAVYGWQCLFVMDPGVFAALATGVTPYVIVVSPRLAGHETLIALAVIWSTTAIALAGWRFSARAMVGLTVLKLVVLLTVVGLAFATGGGDGSHFSGVGAGVPPTTPLPAGLAIAAVSVFFSFGGFWEASRVADRVMAPERTLPRAMTAGVGCIALVYVLTTCAFIYALPPSATGTGPEFAARLGDHLFGRLGGAIFAGIVSLSVMTSALALVMFAPQLYGAMDSDGIIPSGLVSAGAGSARAYRGTLVLAVLASLLASIAGFTAILTYFMAPTLTFVALAAWTAKRARASAPDATAPPSLRREADADGSAGTTMAATAFVVLLVAIIVLVSANQPLQAGAGFVVTAIGALMAVRRARRAPSPLADQHPMLGHESRGGSPEHRQQER